MVVRSQAVGTKTMRQWGRGEPVVTSEGNGVTRDEIMSLGLL